LTVLLAAVRSLTALGAGWFLHLTAAAYMIAGHENAPADMGVRSNNGAHDDGECVHTVAGFCGGEKRPFSGTSGVSGVRGVHGCPRLSSAVARLTVEPQEVCRLKLPQLEALSSSTSFLI